MRSAFSEVIRLAGRAVGEYRMIEDGDRLLAGISGGKDSLTMLRVLLELKRKAPIRFEIVTATFDPGFDGFDSAVTEEYCRSLGTEHHTVMLNIPELLAEKKVTGTPCAFCSRIRRGKLYGLASELHCEKLALGQHLDDTIVSFLISLVRGGGLTTMGPNVPSDGEKIRVIRPLIFVPESLIAEAAGELDLPVHGECIYHDELQERGDRAWGKALLDQIEQRVPDVRSNMLRSLSDVRPPWLLDKKFLK